MLIQSARNAPVPAAVNEKLAGVLGALRRPTTVQWSAPGNKPGKGDRRNRALRLPGGRQSYRDATEVSIPVKGVPVIKPLKHIGNQVQPFAQVHVDIPN